MTIQECYQMLGGDYDQVMARLPSAKMIERFVGLFLNDASYEQLCQAMAAGNRAEAFRAAHTLKGVSANLSFTKLMTSVSELTELLRPESAAIPAGADRLMETVRQDYETTVSAIRAYQGK